MCLLAKNPKVFLVAVTQILGHMTQFTHCSSFKFSNVMLANTFVGYFKMFLTKLCCRDRYDHLDISGCQWLSIGMSSTFDETGLWDAMVHPTEICTTELCYVLHGTLGCFFQITFKLIGFWIPRSICTISP